MGAHVHQAVILAAGKGTRIRGTDQVLPKPLVRVGGISLLKRSILTAKKAGITRFVVVIGCDGDRVRAELANDPEISGVELVWAENADYHLGNGVSVQSGSTHRWRVLPHDG